MTITHEPAPVNLAGRSVTDEHCFGWLYDGQFLRDHHVVRGDSVPCEGETTCARDAKDKRIACWYIADADMYLVRVDDVTGTRTKEL